MSDDQAKRTKQRMRRDAAIAPAPPAVPSARTAKPAGQRKATPASSTNPPAVHPEQDDYDAYDAYDGADQVEDKTDIICVLRGGQLIAMMDRNTMKWDNALSALIRDGHIKLTPEQEQLVQMEIRLQGHPSWFHLRRASAPELSQWTDAGNPVLKAAKAKSGEGRTTSFTANRIRSLSARLGRDDIEVPPGSAESSKLERSLSAEYKLRKENGTLPATDRQIAFATDLAAQCGIAVPTEVIASSKAASEFIDRCLLIAPPSERQLLRARQVAGNKPIPEEALKSAKAIDDWIERTEQANFEALLGKHRGDQRAP